VTQADRIRDYIVKTVIKPARVKGLKTVTVRAGDIHDGMKLANAHPAICSALGGRKLAATADLQLLDRQGPPNGANVYFRFGLTGTNPRPGGRPPPIQRPHKETHRKSNAAMPDFVNALVLVSCTKSKRSGRMAAQDVYGSSVAFRMKKTLIEKFGARWMILSAKHGLLDPTTEIERYDVTLKAMSMTARRVWAREVLETLLPMAAGFDRVVILAGQSYCQFLVPALRQAGYEVVEPVVGLTQGRQLAWLAQRQ